MDSEPTYFPPARFADQDADGFLIVDAGFTVDKMLDAYRHGIFPWPIERSETDDASDAYEDDWLDGWHSPDPRAILPLDQFRIPKRLRRKLNSGQFLFRWNTSFAEVLERCATVGDRQHNRWLSPQLQGCLLEMHAAGLAHSVEAYTAEHELCGGVYGVAIEGFFSAESMFHLVSDASKAALSVLVAILLRQGFSLLDIQVTSEHMQNLGAIEIPRDEYLETLERALARRCEFPPIPQEPISFGELECTPAD